MADRSSVDLEGVPGLFGADPDAVADWSADHRTAVERDRAQQPPGPAGLTDRQLAMLTFEREWWRHAGRVDDERRGRFGVDTDAYAAELDELLATDAALEHDRMLVVRLRRLRAQQRRREG